uniref:Uncharacterized protein n=1 Tax=Ananas comosus var. bracteatus TaxID=296719 RepID=A0A6V7PH43_ANACO|nr:unnamed protein product [Ananas comosus var. bracteatus]
MEVVDVSFKHLLLEIAKKLSMPEPTYELRVEASGQLSAYVDIERVVDSVPTYGLHPENRDLKLSTKISKEKILGCSRVGLCRAEYRYRIDLVPELEVVPVQHRAGTGTQCVFLRTRGSGLRRLLPGTGTLSRVPVRSADCSLAVFEGFSVIIATPYIPPHPLARAFVLQQRRRRGRFPLHFPWFILSFCLDFGGLFSSFALFWHFGDLSTIREALDEERSFLEDQSPTLAHFNLDWSLLRG